MLDDKLSPGGQECHHGLISRHSAAAISPHNGQLRSTVLTTSRRCLGLLNRYLPFTALVVQQDAQAADAMRLLREFNPPRSPGCPSSARRGPPWQVFQLTPPLTRIEYPSERLAPGERARAAGTATRGPASGPTNRRSSRGVWWCVSRYSARRV